MPVIATVQSTLAGYFDDFETPVGRVLNFGITGLILLSCGLFVAQTYALPPLVQGGLWGLWAGAA